MQTELISKITNEKKDWAKVNYIRRKSESERHFSQSVNKTLMVRASLPKLSIPCILHKDMALGISNRLLLVLILSDARLAEVLKIWVAKHRKVTSRRTCYREPRGGTYVVKCQKMQT